MKKKITAKDFRKYFSLVPDDVEVWVGIGEYNSALVDILKDSKNNRVILVDKTYLEDCVELK